MEYISTYALFHLENLPSMKIKKKQISCLYSMPSIKIQLIIELDSNNWHMQQLILDSSLEDIKTEAKDVEGANLRLENPQSSRLCSRNREPSPGVPYFRLTW